MLIEIPLETPSKKNSRITDRRTGRSFPSKAYRKWHDEAALFVKSGHFEKLKGPVRVRMTFTHGSLRKCDSDNKVSSIFDLLVDTGIIEDDEWKVVNEFSVRNVYDRNNPSCRIEIERIE